MLWCGVTKLPAIMLYSTFCTFFSPPLYYYSQVGACGEVLPLSPGAGARGGDSHHQQLYQSRPRGCLQEITRQVCHNSAHQFSNFCIILRLLFAKQVFRETMQQDCLQQLQQLNVSVSTKLRFTLRLLGSWFAYTSSTQLLLSL